MVTYQLSVMVHDDEEPKRLSEGEIVDILNNAECPAGVTVEVSGIKVVEDEQLTLKGKGE